MLTNQTDDFIYNQSASKSEIYKYDVRLNISQHITSGKSPLHQICDSDSITKRATNRLIIGICGLFPNMWKQGVTTDRNTVCIYIHIERKKQHLLKNKTIFKFINERWNDINFINN